MTRGVRWVLGAAVLLAIAGGSYLGWRSWRHPDLAPEAPADSAQAGLRAVTLWFADESGDSLVAETREMMEQEDVHERLGQLVAALVQGPTRRGVAVLPAGTSVLHAYLDDQGQLTLDLSRAFQQGFRGGTTAEDLAVGSLLRTIGGNLPQVKRVLIVCGGAPIASLGGHVPLDQPLRPAEWP